ncbi:MAG: hypothetical protein GX316_02275 [Firmicutes bacterium]|nr:hypothetical protein [Bacillota bacterium]
MKTIYRQATPADLDTVTTLLCRLYGENQAKEKLLLEHKAILENAKQAVFFGSGGIPPQHEIELEMRL